MRVRRPKNGMGVVRVLFLYVGDAIVAEPELGERPAECVTEWKEIARSDIWEDCINREKPNSRAIGLGESPFYVLS